MRRLAPVLGAIAAIGTVMPLFVGVGPRTFMFTLPVFGGLGVLALVASRHTAVTEPTWSAPAERTGGLSTPVHPIRREIPPARRVVAALARVEARELAASPWFGVGIGFLAVSFIAFAIVYASDNGEHWVEVIALAPWLAHPLVGMVVLAAHRGVTRARRDGADELFDALPVGSSTRTWGFLGSAWVPVLSLVVFSVVYGTTVAVRSPNLYGSPAAGSVPVVLSALVLGVGGVVLGVALGRWVRFALAPIVAVVAVGFVSLKLASAGDPGWNPLSQLATFPPLSSQGPTFTDEPAWSHLAWVLALTGAVLLVAIARHRRDRTVAVLGVAACLLVAVTGVAATRPMPGPSAARIANLIADPARYQACLPADSTRVCAYPGNEELAGRFLAEVTPVVAALPNTVPPLTFRQRFPGQLEDLPPEVARKLGDGVPPVPAGEATLGFDGSSGAVRVPRFLVALGALGVPLEAGPDGSPAVLAGQARGVVAIWLATRGLDPGTAAKITAGRTAHNGEPGPEPLDSFDRGFAWPQDCGSPVVWSAQDLRAARAIAAIPEAGVLAGVHQGWDRWRDPATGTDELLAALGLPPVGPFDAVQTRNDKGQC